MQLAQLNVSGGQKQQRRNDEDTGKNKWSLQKKDSIPQK